MDNSNAAHVPLKPISTGVGKKHKEIMKKAIDKSKIKKMAEKTKGIPRENILKNAPPRRKFN